MELIFDFTQQASRSQILDTILEAMDANQRNRFDSFMEEMVIPDHHHHNLAEIEETINALTLPSDIKENAIAVYTILANAEAKVHGCTVETTHFHEVGNAAGIRNTLAICIGIHVLAPEHIKATSIQAGKGKVECAHGLMDIPAPATQAIIDTGLPVYEERYEGERCTPTSAAIIKHFVQEFI